MYNWLFFKVYGYYKSKGNNDPVFNSSLLVFFAQVVHLSVLLFGALKVFNFDIPWISTDKAVNKMIFIPILYLWSVLISKRSEEHTSELQSRPHLVCRLLL